MTIAMSTATRCNCGAHVTAVFLSPCQWLAACLDCSAAGYDVAGRGTTFDEALWAWMDQCDLRWVPNKLFDELAQQATNEAQRQLDWSYSATGDSPTAPRVYGPAGAAVSAA